jgi:tetratricopeptide (TPR) repeat protein
MSLINQHEVRINQLCRNRRYGDALSFLKSVYSDYVGLSALEVASYYTSMARVQSNRGDYDSADALFKRSLDIYPDSSETKLAKAESYIQRGKLNDAANILKDLYEVPPADMPIGSRRWVMSHTLMLRCMKLRGDYKAGLLCFNALRPYLDSRDVAFRDRDFMDRMVRSTHPDSPMAATGSFSKYLREREATGTHLYGNAFACIFLENRLSETDDKYHRVVIHSFLARIYLDANQLEKAREQIESARAITEINPYINGYSIGLTIKCGFNEKARAEYQAHAEELNRHAPIALFLARSFQMAGEYDLAMALSETVLSHKRLRPETHQSAEIILHASRSRMSMETSRHP